MADPAESTPADRWWFARGAQSALFFYLGCGPCSSIRGEKRRRKAAQRSKQEKEMMRAENPGVNYHPAPFEMNPHWEEEMRLGPGPPPRRARKGTRESRESRGDATTADGSIASSVTDFSRMGEVNKSGPLEAGGAPGGWNIKRYHRADEEFIEAVVEENAAQVTAANGITMDTSGAAIQKPEPSYGRHRAPPINDMHPPSVSLLPTAWQDRQWMKAPPPSRGFMEGKKGVTALSRGSSAASRPTVASVQHWLGSQDVQPQVLSDSDMHDFSITKNDLMQALDMTDTDAPKVSKRYSVRRQRSRRNPHKDSISSADSYFGQPSSDSDTEAPSHPVSISQPTHIRANRTAKLPRSPKRSPASPLLNMPVNPLLLSPATSPSKGKGKARSPVRSTASASKQTLPPQDSMEALDSGDSFSIRDAKVSRRRSARLLENGRQSGLKADDDAINDALHWTNYRHVDPADGDLRTVPVTGQRWSTEF